MSKNRIFNINKFWNIIGHFLNLEELLYDINLDKFNFIKYIIKKN